MPRIKRRGKRRNDYTENEKKCFMEGVALTCRFSHIHKGYPDRPDMVEMRRAWLEDLRDELLPLWIAQHPFTRPLGWLLFEATEPRLRVVGEQALEAAEFQKTRGHCYRLCYFEDLNRKLGHEDTRSNEAEWETEKQYLCRLNLLTDLERDLL